MIAARRYKFCLLFLFSYVKTLTFCTQLDTVYDTYGLHSIGIHKHRNNLRLKCARKIIWVDWYYNISRRRTFQAKDCFYVVHIRQTQPYVVFSAISVKNRLPTIDLRQYNIRIVPKRLLVLAVRMRIPN
jgi:hypothetical protein